MTPEKRGVGSYFRHALFSSGKIFVRLLSAINQLFMCILGCLCPF